MQHSLQITQILPRDLRPPEHLQAIRPLRPLNVADAGPASTKDPGTTRSASEARANRSPFMYTQLTLSSAECCAFRVCPCPPLARQSDSLAGEIVRIASFSAREPHFPRRTIGSVHVLSKRAKSSCSRRRLLRGHPGCCLDRRRGKADDSLPCRKTHERPAPPGGGEVITGWPMRHREVRSAARGKALVAPSSMANAGPRGARDRVHAVAIARG